jgi:hypothetical protein
LQPIPLELLTLANFTDPPTQRGAGILRFGNRGGGSSAHPDQHMSPGPMPPSAGGGSASPEQAADGRAVYPCTLHHTGRLGGLHVLYAETAPARAEWREKLGEAQGLRKVVQEANKVFEVETLSVDTFLAPSFPAAPTSGSWNAEGALTGQVTCSVPFSASLACGCLGQGLNLFGGSDGGRAGARGGWVRGGCVDRIPARCAVYVLVRFAALACSR